MNKIQIGNSVAVTWNVDLSSAKGKNTLTVDKTELYLRSAYEIKKIESYTINDNVVCFIFASDTQKYTGTYDLVLKDTEAGTRYITKTNAFALVLHEVEERGAINGKDSNGNYVVELADKAVTIKDIDEDAGIYVRVAAIEAKLKDGCILTPEERAFFNNILLANKDKLDTLPDEIVVDVTGTITEDKVDIEIGKMQNNGGEDGYQDLDEVLNIAAATTTKAGVMSAADKQRLEQGVKSVDLNDLDKLNNTTDGEAGKPVVYAVTSTNPIYGSRNVGVLLLFSDDMEHVTTQILTTHCYYNSSKKAFNGHTDNKIYQYSRVYNNSASHGLSDMGTWSEWSPFIDDTIASIISIMNKNISNLQDALNKISSLSDSEIDEVWNNN